MAKSDDFLKHYASDSQSEMRWRRDAENRLTNMLMILYALVFTAMAAISEVVSNPLTFLILAFALVVYLVAHTYLVSQKIEEEHRVYEDVGASIVKVWDHFGLFDSNTYGPESILTEQARVYGKGTGYLTTKRVIWSMTLVVSLVLVTVGLLKYLN